MIILINWPFEKRLHARINTIFLCLHFTDHIDTNNFSRVSRILKERSSWCKVKHNHAKHSINFVRNDKNFDKISRISKLHTSPKHLQTATSRNCIEFPVLLKTGLKLNEFPRNLLFLQRTQNKYAKSNEIRLIDCQKIYKS